jgi:PKD domain-containing protein
MVRFNDILIYHKSYFGKHKSEVIMKRSFLCFLIILFSFLLITSGCEEGVDNSPVYAGNRSPVISSITASDSTLDAGGTTILTCIATDAENDDLTYLWSSTSGSFPEGTTGFSVQWTAPNSTGTYDISVEVSDNNNSDEDAITIIVENSPPDTPSMPSPPDGATEIASTGSTLQWTCSDLNGDALTYEVCFGTSSTPPNLGTVSSQIYDPGTLDAATTYYWKIVADDGAATNSSPVWSFTTEPIGELLSYDDGTMDGGLRLEEAGGWIWTRFTIPDGWSAVRVTNVDIYMYGGTDRSFDICGNDAYDYNGDLGLYFPPNNGWYVIESNRSQSVGWYEHNIAPSPTFESNHFFVGVGFRYDDGPYVGYDLNDPSSGRSGFTDSTTRIVFTDAEWGIRVYVEQVTYSSSQVGNVPDRKQSREELNGIWIDGSAEIKNFDKVLSNDHN